MKQTIELKIDVSKISKNRLYKGAKGTYLTAILFLGEEDQYGNNGMIVEGVSKEERDAGVKGVILGNARLVGGTKKSSTQINPIQDKQEPIGDDDHSLPF